MMPTNDPEGRTERGGEQHSGGRPVCRDCGDDTDLDGVCRKTHPPAPTDDDDEDGCGWADSIAGAMVRKWRDRR